MPYRYGPISIPNRVLFLRRPVLSESEAISTFGRDNSVKKIGAARSAFLLFIILRKN